MNRLSSPQVTGTISIDEIAIHHIITLEAGPKTRAFCNHIWCTYDEIFTDSDELTLAITEHESLNFSE
jgi:hypothetical protein